MDEVFISENGYRLSFEIIAGMDEAGRGPLCGPVVAACVVMDAKNLVEGVKDSKKLSEKKREALYPKILERALACGVGVVEADEIDRINILNATKKAFLLAYSHMLTKPQLLLIDGRDIIEVDTAARAVVHGDALCYSIAAASIIAKVTRDRMMIEYDGQYPQYGFARHKGYGTAEHMEAIRRYGPCPLHRRTFIKKLV